jgi:acyl-CoA thioesterase I
MKHIVYLLLFLLLTSCGKTIDKHTVVSRGASVLILGDSLSYGTGAYPGEDYPSLLANLTGWKIRNEGVPGDTSAQGLARLPALLDAERPHLLIVELGGNDFLHQVPESVTYRNLSHIVSLAKAQGVTTVLVAIPEFSKWRAAISSLQDHPLYEKLADETQTALITDVFSEVLSEQNLKADQIHPNAQGYALVARMMHEKLKALGFIN